MLEKYIRQSSCKSGASACLENNPNNCNRTARDPVSYWDLTDDWDLIIMPVYIMHWYCRKHFV